MGNPYAPSIDRIDSDVGYTVDNVRVVLNCVNQMLNCWTDEEMAPLVEALRKDAHEPLDTD